MYLLELSLYEFRQFLQIVLWISLPLVVICLSVATFLHYRRKKKTNKDSSSAEHEHELIQLNPVQPMLSVNNKNSENDLIKQYEQQLRSSRDKYHTLERSFRRLQENYSSILANVNDENTEAGNSTTPDQETKIRAYELKIAQLQQALTYMENNGANEVHGISNNSTAEKEQLKEMELQVNALKEELSKQADENESLKNELSATAMASINDNRTSLQNPDNNNTGKEHDIHTHAENAANIGYLEEMVQQKNLQVEFLQQQLDQKIKHNHSLEQQERTTSQVNNKLQSEIENAKNSKAALEENIQSKQKEVESLQVQLTEQSHKADQLQQSLQLKVNEVTQFMSELSELRYENTSLHESVADSTRELLQLKEELAGSRLQAKEFEEKWEASSRIISHIYREISGTMVDAN